MWCLVGILGRQLVDHELAIMQESLGDGKTLSNPKSLSQLDVTFGGGSTKLWNHLSAKLLWLRLLFAR